MFEKIRFASMVISMIVVMYGNHNNRNIHTYTNVCNSTDTKMEDQRSTTDDMKAKTLVDR